MADSKAIRDISEGNPASVLVRFALPLILSGVFQQLYNIADSAVVGVYAGEDGIAAVGASYPIIMLFIALAIGASTGGAVIISQFFGAKNYKDMKTAISTVFIAMLALSAICMVVGLVFCTPLLRLMSVPQNIFADCALYLRIYVWGLPFLFVYNAATSVFNGLGNSRTPLYFLIFSSLSNVGLDILFVAVFDMGVAGVAWATFLAQGVSAVLAAGYLFTVLRKIETERYERFNWQTLRTLSRVAVPNMLNMSAVSVGQLLIQFLVNSYGPVVIAGYSAAIKIDSFFKIVISTMGNAMTTFTAQNIGAGKPERVREGKNALLKVAAVYCVISAVLLQLLAPHIMGPLFGQQLDSDFVRISAQYMRQVPLFYFSFALMVVYNGILRGVGYMRMFVTVVFVDLGLRVVFSYLLASLNIGYSAIWWSIPIGWTAGAVIAIVTYYRGKWKQVQIVERTE